jgi:uncharacterized repeat protein (TIGR02543 family)
MTNDQLLIECKKGLNISLGTTALDGALTQKLLAVKSYMKSAGVSEAKMSDDLAVGVIVMGVADLWDINPGETKFSNLFYTLLSQLVVSSQRESYYFSIVYNGNNNTGGGTPVDRNVYSQSEKATVLDNLGFLERTGYKFAGWNTLQDGSGKDYAARSTILVGVSNITLYAKWVAN